MPGVIMQLFWLASALWVLSLRLWVLFSDLLFLAVHLSHHINHLFIFPKYFLIGNDYLFLHNSLYQHSKDCLSLCSKYCAKRKEKKRYYNSPSLNFRASNVNYVLMFRLLFTIIFWCLINCFKLYINYLSTGL